MLVSECFDILKQQLPAQADEKKTSNLSILHSALRYIQNLKRKERELEHEMERLARDKISSQQRLAVLKKEVTALCDNVDFNALLPDQLPPTPFSNDEAKIEDALPVVEPITIPQLPKSQFHTNGFKEVSIIFV